MKSMDLDDKSFILKLIDDMFCETNDILWYYDLCTGYLRISDKIKKICGLDSEFHIDSIEKLLSITVKRDQNNLISAFQNLYMGLDTEISKEIRLICGNGKTKSFLLKGKQDASIPEEAIGNTIVTGTITDIEDMKEREAKLNYATYYDSLTGLVNRNMFIYKANSYIRQEIDSLGSITVLYINIDNFKQINDLYGHAAGDAILMEASSRIASVLDAENILSRPGGDEFLVLIQNISREKLLYKVKEIQQEIYKIDNMGKEEIILTSSVGAARFPEDGDCAEELIKNAHTALYKAKEQGNGKYCFYDKQIKDEIVKGLELEKNLRNALKNGEFYIEYQPQIDFNTGLIAGAEALLRWKSPVYGQVSPIEFIPVAEKMGIIVQIGIWVLEQACSQCKKWMDSYGIGFRISVNISALQLKKDNFLNIVMNTVKRSGLPEEKLEIEITESTLLDDFEKSTLILKRLRENGIKIALDDFGTGYSSLNYLKNLPLDTLKIDKSFIKCIGDGEREKAITGTIISLAHILDLNVIAEGVETREQAEQLRIMNCNLMQGYYFSKPVGPEVIEALFREEKKCMVTVLAVDEGTFIDSIAAADKNRRS